MENMAGTDAAQTSDDPSRCRICIGAQGFSPKDWVGTFYPPRHPQRDFLPFYAQVLNTVELNTTFYAIPSASTVRAWAQRTPPQFVFTAKLPRVITHDKKLLGVEGELSAFVDRISLLGNKLGAVLIQFPRSFSRRFEDRFRAFLALLPPHPRFAVEFRSESWNDSSVFDLLREFGVAWCVNHWQDLPPVVETTADFAYFRLVGFHQEFTYLGELQRDRSEQLASLAGTISDMATRLNRIYVYINNHYEGHAPATIQRLKDLVGLPRIDPHSLWPERQTSLPGMAE
jgi:uncharacterized protein YecE (DUF72 family)